MKGFNTDTQLDEIITWAKQFGNTENVLMRRLKPGDRTFKGSVFITYNTREEAEAAQKSDAKFKDIELTELMQDEYWVVQNQKTKEARAANKASKSPKNNAEAIESENPKNAVQFEKGLILAVDGLGADSSVDSIKTFFMQYGSVEYVAHEHGSKTAKIRFNNDSEGGAQKAWEKAAEAGTDGKVILQKAELVGRVLEGKEEKYWTEFNARKNQKQGGGRGGCGDSRKSANFYLLFEILKGISERNKNCTLETLIKAFEIVEDQEPFASLIKMTLSFDDAAAKVKTLKTSPSNDELLKLYALFKQGTIGDNNTSKPGMFAMKGKAKWSAWDEKKGTSKEAAQAAYVALVEELIAKYGD
uniref:ACB domain-containing protein n=1 Tax=Caenorhabditis tropicalis TaxID=1561998 RepID=A0A1I7UEK9_9PELO